MATKKRKTNVELVTEFMEFGNPLKQAFVIEALLAYAIQQANAEPWKGNAFISQEAWKECAGEFLKTYEGHTGVKLTKP